MSSDALKRLSLLSLFLILIPLPAEQGHAKVNLKPENQELTLTGVLQEVHGYGPPGYGEDKKHDSRITYWAIELPTEINLACTPERPEWRFEDCASTKRLHLFFQTFPEGRGLELKVRAAKGKKMVVTGVLHRADTAGELTAIYMDVTAIRPSP